MKQREIKFRAWDIKRKEMFYVNSLNSYSDKDQKPLQVRRYQGDMPEDFHLMQFTGLKDKNGVEIYENDLVQHPAWDYPFKVIFIQDFARFVCEMQTGLTQSIKGEILTVVGNVYQTPLK